MSAVLASLPGLPESSNGSEPAERASSPAIVSISARNLLETPVAVITPVYNEAPSIERTVNELAAVVFTQNRLWKLLVFEDGSRDGTKEILQRLERVHNWIEVRMTDRRKGYPRAVRDAILAVDPTSTPFVLFLDSDGQYDPKDARRLVKALEDSSADIAIGQRAIRKEEMYRRVLSKGLYYLERLLFRPACHDVTSAFRLMRTDVAQRIARRVVRSRFNFWLEFTARMTLDGCRTVEVPVVYRSRAGNSNVYALTRMPHVVAQEFVSLISTWSDRRSL